MASKKTGVAAIYGKTLNIAFGLVNIPVKYGPSTGTGAGAPGGKFVCPCHGEPIVSSRTCAQSGEVVSPETGFEVDGKLVTGIKREDYRAVKDGQLKLEGSIDLNDVDPLYFESTQLLWPQAGGEQAYNLLATALGESGKALIGKAALTTSTRIIAVGWSDDTNTLVAHVLNFSQNIRWNEAKAIHTAIADQPAPTAAEIDLAKQIAGSLPEVAASDYTDDFSDDYAENLTAAIVAVAAGLPAPVVEAEEAAPATTDLLATLQASVEAVKAPAKPKAKAKAKPRKKAAA